MTDRYPAELNTVARVKIGVGGVVTSARRWLDLVAGTGVTLTPVDDGVNEKVTVTVGVTGAPPTGNAGGDLTGTYPNPTIGAGKVVTAGILDANVTTAKIADANVTLAKLASEAWTTYAPTITQSGTVTYTGTYAKAEKRGRTVCGSLYLTVTGSGTGTNVVTVTLPYTAATSTTLMLGTGYIYDISAVAVFPAFVELATSTTLQLRGTATPLGFLGNLGFTAGLAVNDLVVVNFSYEAAT